MGGVIAFEGKPASHHTLAFISFYSLKRAVIQKRLITLPNYNVLQCIRFNPSVGAVRE